MKEPRLLAICESPISSNQGFGVTLETLVADWPRERLRVLYRSAEFRDQRVDVYRQIHAPIPGRLVRDALPFALGRRPQWGQRRSPHWIRKALDGWLPEVIYGFYYDGSIPRYAAWLAEEFACPYLVHIGDEGSTLRAIPPPEIARIYSNAAARIAISEVMAQEYAEEYDLPFEVLHNGAAEQFFTGQVALSSPEEPLIIRYVGSLLREQHWDAIEDVVQAVRKYNQEGGRARFEIYCGEWTARYARELADGRDVFYEGFAPKPQLFEVLKTADLLILPISFRAQDYAYRLSMPTKLCEYLASGKPTLIYGPKGSAAVELCSAHGLGWVHTVRNVEAIVGRLRQLRSDPGGSLREADSSRQFARNHLSAASMSGHFRQLLLESIHITSRS